MAEETVQDDTERAAAPAVVKPLAPVSIVQRATVLVGALLVAVSFLLDTPQGWLPGLVGTALSLSGWLAFGPTLRNYRVLAVIASVLGLMCVAYGVLVFNGLIDEAALRAGR